MPGNHATGTAGVLGSSELNRDTAGLQGTYGWAVQSGAVTFSTGLTFNVAAIATADYKVAGVNGASYAGGTVTLAAQDATNPRVDIIVVTVAGAVSAVAGTPVALTSTGGPVPLAPTAAQLEIARIYVPATGGLLSASSITDRRVSLPGTAVVLTTTGDVMYASAAHTVARLGIGTAGQSLQVSGGLPAWVTVAAAGADYQAFTGSGTWTKPAGAGASSWTLVRLWGAGGGGGGGMGDIAGTTRRGSGGGGAGGLTEAWFLTSLLSATETLTVGAGGTGGAGGVSAQGVTGVVGGNTSFGTLAFAYGGGGGGFGYSTDALAGGGGGGSLSAGATPTTVLYNVAAGGAPTYYSYGTTPLAYSGIGSGGAWATTDLANVVSNAEFGGGAGGAGGNASDTASAGGSSRWGGGAGGGGGGVNSGNAERAGGAGGSSNTWTSGGGGAGGAVNGGAGTAGTTGVGTNYGGTGGGGGGGQDSGTGGVGAVGGAKGGGGGGGGSGTSTGGAGAAGGVGYAQIITFI